METTKEPSAVQDATGFTGRYTAGLRYIESTNVAKPVIPSDPLAGELAGERGIELAKRELEQLAAVQGPGKHLRVPARSRLIDDLLCREVEALQASSTAQAHGSHKITSSEDVSLPAGAGASCGGSSSCCCQVVSLGAGMCTRPWRLPALAHCAVIELDLPHIARTKLELLAAAAAETARHGIATARTTQHDTAAPSAAPADPSAPAVAPAAAASAASAAAAEESPPGPEPADGPHAQARGSTGEGATPTLAPGALATAPEPGPPNSSPSRFPLLAGSYACIGVDLASVTPAGLAAALAGAGFDPRRPTVWVLEALLYYMPLQAASDLLCRLADLSAPSSRLIATCVDRELLEASIRGVPEGHVFANLWHFEAEALLYGTEALTSRWTVDWAQQPPEEGPGPGPGAATASTTAAVDAAEGAEAASATEPEEAEMRQASSGVDNDGGGGGGASAPGLAAAELRPGAVEQRRRLPASTRRLAQEWLGAETYVALYGGSELLFTCELRGEA